MVEEQTIETARFSLFLAIHLQLFFSFQVASSACCCGAAPLAEDLQVVCSGRLLQVVIREEQAFCVEVKSQHNFHRPSNTELNQVGRSQNNPLFYPFFFQIV